MKNRARKNKRDAQETGFTVEEIKLFKRRLENKYDIETDERYTIRG